MVRWIEGIPGGLVDGSYLGNIIDRVLINTKIRRHHIIGISFAGINALRSSINRAYVPYHIRDNSIL